MAWREGLPCPVKNRVGRENKREGKRTTHCGTCMQVWPLSAQRLAAKPEKLNPQPMEQSQPVHRLPKGLEMLWQGSYNSNCCSHYQISGPMENLVSWITWPRVPDHSGTQPDLGIWGQAGMPDDMKGPTPSTGPVQEVAHGMILCHSASLWGRRVGCH